MDSEDPVAARKCTEKQAALERQGLLPEEIEERFWMIQMLMKMRT
jgi:hypothetical protein